MHTAQQNHAPHDEPRNEGAPQPATPHVPATTSTARINRAWRCFLGALALLGIFIVHGCGGGNSTISPPTSSSANVSIQVRDRNTGALLPASPVSTRTPAAGETPVPTSAPSPLTVRLTGKSFDKSVTFTNAQAGAQFSSVPRGTYQVFVGGQRSSPDIVVANTSTGGSTQSFTVIPGLSNGSQFLSKVTITGRTLLSVPAIVTPGSGVPTATPTPSTSCPSSSTATGAYLVRVINYNTKSVVAVYSKPDATENYTITNLPLDSVSGKAVSTTFYLQIFTDPSDTSINTAFAGQSALFTVRAGSSGTATLPDICATQGGLIRTPTATSTTGALTPTATSSGVDFPTPVGG